MSMAHLHVFHYSCLSASPPSPSLLSQILLSLRPPGPGLLVIHGVPGFQSLRKALLPLARTLSLLPLATRSNILKDHGLGTDVPLKDPHRPVSSFATQLKFGAHASHSQLSLSTASELDETATTSEGHKNRSVSLHFFTRNVENVVISSCPSAGIPGLHQLGDLFRRLGSRMVDVGLQVARLCDMAIDGANLEEAILESRTAKGRLIHYHSLQERSLLHATTSTVAKKKSRKHQSFGESSNGVVDVGTDLWQQWHFDYGIFTVLTTPMFLSPLIAPTNHDEHTGSSDGLLEQSMSAYECEPPNGHTGLKILNTAKFKVDLLSIPEDCLIVQVGEAAQILTSGKLQATAHCVSRPVAREHVSRETFAVFLQPSWEKCLVSPEGLTDALSFDGSFNDVRSHGTNTKEVQSMGEDLVEIRNKIPHLESRWKTGCTFAEFSRETTRQYYGVDGAQSRK